MRAKNNIDGQNIAMSCNKDGIEMSGDEATNKWLVDDRDCSFRSFDHLLR